MENISEKLEDEKKHKEIKDENTEKKNNILVLGKSNDDIDFICNTSKEKEYEYIKVYNIEDAEKKINEISIKFKSIEIAILDIELKKELKDKKEKSPEFKLISELRKKNSKVVIIIYTSSLDIQCAIEAVRLGVFEYILKPVDPDILKKKIDSAIDKYRKDKVSELYFHTIIHDLKSPITSFGLLIMNLEKYSFNMKEKNDMILKYIKIGNRAVSNAVKMVDSILNVEKLRSEKYAVKSEKFNIIECVKEALALFEPISNIEKFNFNLIFDFSEDLIIKSDKNIYEHIFYNLVSNCKRYSLSGTYLDIKLECKDDSLITSVKNIGSYIADYNRTKIFDKFVQVQSEENTNKNFGLGLSFCKVAVEYLNGKIWIDSYKDSDVEIDACDSNSRSKMSTTFFYSVPLN